MLTGPVSHGPHINVDKLAVGVIADTPCFLAGRAFKQLDQFLPRKVNIRRLALDVEAVLGGISAFSAQHIIGFTASVSGYQPNRRLKSDFGLEVMEQIDQARIDGFDSTGSEVTHDEVDFIQGRLDIAAPFPVDRG